MLRCNVSRLTKEGALGACGLGDRQVGRNLGRLEGDERATSGFEVVRDCFTEGGDSAVARRLLPGALTFVRE